ncbi:hypothetical protein ACFE04_027204 [Oxalis oulophora]
MMNLTMMSGLKIATTLSRMVNVRFIEGGGASVKDSMRQIESLFLLLEYILLALNVKKVVIGAFILRTIITNNEHYEKYFKVMPTLRPSQPQSLEREDVGSTVIRNMCSVAKKRLHDYVAELHMKNHGSSVELYTQLGPDVRKPVIQGLVFFGKEIAILAGDALISQPFENIAKNTKHASPDKILRAIAILGSAVGTEGLVTGQIVVIANEARNVSLSELEYIYAHKTGCLLGHSWVQEQVMIF